jgi:hypothetical protein
MDNHLLWGTIARLSSQIFVTRDNYIVHSFMIVSNPKIAFTQNPLEKQEFFLIQKKVLNGIEGIVKYEKMFL